MKIHVPSDCDNAPRKAVIRDFNIAFATNNVEAIVTFMDKDIIWEMVGGKTMKGLQEAREMLKTMQGEKAEELTIHTIITHGDSASGNGVMKYPGGSIGFCDVYEFTGHTKDAKIKRLTSYGVEIG